MCEIYGIDNCFFDDRFGNVGFCMHEIHNNKNVIHAKRLQRVVIIASSKIVCPHCWPNKAHMHTHYISIP